MLFGIACSFAKFVADAISDHIVEYSGTIYSSIGLITALYVESNVSLFIDFEYSFECFGNLFVVSEFKVEDENRYYGLRAHV